MLVFKYRMIKLSKLYGQKYKTDLIIKKIKEMFI